jgi:competence ComEA-like helix-hairpin-helix protein
MERKKIKEYLRFNYKERLAFFILIIIVAIIFMYPFVFNNKDEQPLTIIKSTSNEIVKEDDSKREYETHKDHSSYQYKSYSNYSPKKNIKLFYFDPNTTSVEDWQNLGLRDRTIKTISNYLSKGGSFKSKEDLKKIYGLHEDEYARLEPYIKIVSKQETKVYSNNILHTDNYKQANQITSSNTEKRTINDINSADADAFIALPGIGNSFANRIIKFRNKLGGFYSVEQIKETYGLPDSTFQLIKPLLKLNSDVKKININTASKDELKEHPYIRWTIANAIVEYRNQHGAFKSLDELKNIVLIEESTFKKIIPYLTIN